MTSCSDSVDPNKGDNAIHADEAGSEIQDQFSDSSSLEEILSTEGSDDATMSFDGEIPEPTGDSIEEDSSEAKRIKKKKADQKRKKDQKKTVALKKKKGEEKPKKGRKG